MLLRVWDTLDVIVEKGDFRFDCGRQRGKAVLDGTPDHLLGDIIVIVSIDVPRAHDGAPW
jgi:hypothetical protein